MRHRKKGRQLGRQTKHRWALFRSLVTSLLEHERIETTEAKAKEIRGFTDRMITLGKEGTLPARRQALAFIRSKDVVSKLFSKREGGEHDSLAVVMVHVELLEHYGNQNGLYRRAEVPPHV